MKQLSLLSFASGTLIVLAPIAQNVVSMAMIAHLLAIDTKGEFHLNSSLLSNSYQGWCLFIGMCLFVVGVVSGFRADGKQARASAGAPVPPDYATVGSHA